MKGWGVEVGAGKTADSTAQCENQVDQDGSVAQIPRLTARPVETFSRQAARLAHSLAAKTARNTGQAPH